MRIRTSVEVSSHNLSLQSRNCYLRSSFTGRSMPQRQLRKNGRREPSHDTQQPGTAECLLRDWLCGDASTGQCLQQHDQLSTCLCHSGTDAAPLPVHHLEKPAAFSSSRQQSYEELLYRRDKADTTTRVSRPSFMWPR